MTYSRLVRDSGQVIRLPGIPAAAAHVLYTAPDREILFEASTWTYGPVMIIVYIESPHVPEAALNAARRQQLVETLEYLRG